MYEPPILSPCILSHPTQYIYGGSLTEVDIYVCLYTWYICRYLTWIVYCYYNERNIVFIHVLIFIVVILALIFSWDISKTSCNLWLNWPLPCAQFPATQYHTLAYMILCSQPQKTISPDGTIILTIYLWNPMRKRTSSWKLEDWETFFEDYHQNSVNKILFFYYHSRLSDPLLRVPNIAIELALLVGRVGDLLGRNKATSITSLR